MISLYVDSLDEMYSKVLCQSKLRPFAPRLNNCDGVLNKSIMIISAEWSI